MSATEPNIARPRIYVFGASGSGTTTLGRALAGRLSLTHVDTDDHYWAPVEPPFSQKLAPAERVASMATALGGGGWVLSGDCCSWAGEVLQDVTLRVFVTLPTELRLERLRHREKARFASRIEPGGDMFDIHQNFMDWAAHYDDPQFDGRNIGRHESWLASQSGAIVRIDGDVRLEDAVGRVLDQLGGEGGE